MVIKISILISPQDINISLKIMTYLPSYFQQNLSKLIIIQISLIAYQMLEIQSQQFYKPQMNQQIYFKSIYNWLTMLRIRQQKHLAYYDDKHSYTTSYVFTLQRPVEKEDKEKNNNNDFYIKETSLIKIHNIEKLSFEIKIENHFSYEWLSDYYDISTVNKPMKFGGCPFSLQNYLQVYSDPKIHTFNLALHQNTPQSKHENLFDEVIGKIYIKTQFRGNPFKLPVNILNTGNIHIESLKTITIIIENRPEQKVFCSGTLVQVSLIDQISNFKKDYICEEGYKLFKYNVEERVQAESIIILKGFFKIKQFQYDRSIIRIFSFDGQVFFIPTLIQILQQIKALMGQVQPLNIIQNIETPLQDGYRTVFYADLSSFYKRIYRSYLYDKIKDKWLIQGMVNYNRSNKHFQDVMIQLIELITEGEQITTLSDQTFHFDSVWRIKAIFFYHVLSNFKIMRDYGSSSLANLIIEQAKKTKITSAILFKKLKNKYGLKNFRTIYEQQFVKSTGINRIFYQIIDLKRQNRVKIIVRQKSLVNKVFRLYNMFRIKLEQQFNLISPLTQKIINKNKFMEGNKRKQLSGPLAVPKLLKCLPYFRGNVAVETDASEMPFQMELRQENIIEQKQNITSKIRAPIRKIGQIDKAYDGFGWMMIDTAHIFPAVYKNENVHEAVILEKIKKRYDSEHQEIKVLNCISSRDHSANQKICRALIEKVKINTNLKENSTINVKRKILQILPNFLSKATDFNLWEDFLGFLRLYEPNCHDYSQQGYYFLLSLIESIGEIEYKKQLGYYFQHFHRIMLSIFRELNGKGEEREQKLKISILNSLMKWNSRYSLEILEQVHVELKLCRCKIRANLQVLKIIFKNIFGFIINLKLDINHVLIVQINDILASLIEKDNTYILFTIKFKFQLETKEKELTKPLQFLKYAFKSLQEIKDQNFLQYSLALEMFKDILNKSKKTYGLQLQLSSTQNQNYFIAEYLWTELTSSLSCENHVIRLQWIKIYRIFYFYYIPIITIKKIKENSLTKQFREITEEISRDLVENLKDFFPDIKWFSGYDSRSAKQLKAKYQLMNENKKKKRFQQYTFSENNVITMFIKSHPGRQSWDQLGREALRIFISIYEDKEQKSDGKQADKYKSVQQGFKKIEQNLKRGRMPSFYNYEQLKNQIRHLMDQYEQKEVKIGDILDMVDKSLSEINQQKARRQAELRDEMRIIINLSDIPQQEQEQQQEQQNNEGQDDELLFNQDNQNQEDQQPNDKMEAADDDLLIAGQ